ncbi:acyl-CoA dehydrogenase [Pacificimonas flava]|uniref:Acyl-CoA dehydrogenase n=2 Tax=Pacificimonas TaxID=1960290 RepID=A0A219B3W6_9SPHN|nr:MULTISPECIES: acyl-CoA dehydrogenase family protein [Pacificimonas]MBZ6377196.1 acyl-CoA dehydrogenase family protein [Pacificimonas aurantium]OWV33082.1 acyl-CoA dehydrogenase [Pacificimonas flava]
MDFNDTAEEAAYREKVRAWIAENTKEYEGQGAAKTNEEFVARQKSWQKKKYDAGYAGITWPKKFGGQGKGPMESIIFSQEEGKSAAPTGLYAIGLGMCIPTVFTHGSQEVVDRFVPVALEGEEIWCQLFSEPAAGSDLAGIRTKAEKDGDEWVINGQKVWTTNAHLCDYGIIVTRTDPSAPKHKGLTMFIVDMHSEGVEARPLKQMSGGSDFNEVFFDDVRVPDAWRLGDEGQGWQVALTTLMNERLAVGGKPRYSPDWRALLNLAKEIETVLGPASEQADVREEIAKAYINDHGVKLTQQRALSALSQGKTPGPEQSISKVVVAKQMQEISRIALDLSESQGFVKAEPGSELDRFQSSYFGAAGLRIAGGTDEILRNIIAERVLGLPGDLRPPKDTPFNELKPV